MTGPFLGLTAEDWQAVGLSVGLSATAVLLSLAPGVACAWLLARKSFPGKALLETLVHLPLVLPPVVTGLLLLYAFGRRGWIGGWLYDWFGLEIALTWRAAVLALAVMGFPLLVRSIRLALASYDPRLYQVARSLGASPLDAFWSVSLPLARQGLLAGCMLAFARGLGEFGATLMFAGIRPETRTLPIQVYLLNNRPGDAAEARMWHIVAASLTISFLALAISQWLERRIRRPESA
ncbi:MAG TPA: molybdate ABC transporter permease subunit [Pirellulales bacterium]